MIKKPSWDDIPSLKLEVDEDSPSTAPSNRRISHRLSTKDVQEMFMEQVKVIYVQLASKNGILKQKGLLQDISHTGLRFIMPAHPFQQGEMIRLGTILGKFVFKTKAIVQWKTNDQVGVKFIDSKEEDITFLRELYSAKVLNKI